MSLIKSLVVGKAERLESQFRLTYNQILNLLRVEDFDPLEMMSRSFSESSAQKKAPEQRAVLQRAVELLKAAPSKVSDCLFDTPDAMIDYQRVRKKKKKKKKGTSFVVFKFGRPCRNFLW